jgi:4-amino-4-deoxy-L-arabinose transferase-like glycosyltransferase
VSGNARKRRNGKPQAAAARPGAKPPSPATPPGALEWVVTAFCFLAGLACRLVVFTGKHNEGDEIVYRTLVQQLAGGHPYTLQGTWLVASHWPMDQYGNALFFHPPGGIALFWLLNRLFGATGYPLVQILSYAVFFGSTCLLAGAVLGPLRGARMVVVAALAAFTPLMTHVTFYYWLDGPMLAFTTLAAGLFLRAVSRGETRGVILSAVVMGYASWIKTTALIVVPALLLVAWAMSAPAARRAALRFGLLFTALAALIQLPWQLWQLQAVGSAFPAWAGRPSAHLLATNVYVHRLTVERPAWIYLTLLPRAVWTLLPAIACLFALDLDARTRRVGLALLGWIAIVLALVMGLGLIGYSKLLRYAILVTPATVLLFALAAGELWKRLRSPGVAPRERTLVRALVVLTLAGLGLEIAQGIYTPLVDQQDLIQPIVWKGNGLF